VGYWERQQTTHTVHTQFGLLMEIQWKSKTDILLKYSKCLTFGQYRTLLQLPPSD